jgi:hypothetical protein
VPAETRDSLQELFLKKDIPPNNLRRRRGIFRNYDFWKEYAIFYLPTLSLIWSIPIVIYSEMPVEKIFSLVILASFALSTWRLSKKLKGLPKSESFLALLWLNLLTITWMLFLETGMLKAWQYTVNESIAPIWKAVAEIIGVSVLVTCCHVAMAAWARFSFHRLAGAAVIVFTGLVVYPGYSAVGAAALRAAQLGGGTRISYTVVGPRATTSEPATGCLVLATSSYVLISKLDDNICPSLIRFSFTASDVKPRPVRMFSRSEINISEMPDG